MCPSADARRRHPSKAAGNGQGGRRARGRGRRWRRRRRSCLRRQAEHEAEGQYQYGTIESSRASERSREEAVCAAALWRLIELSRLRQRVCPAKKHSCFREQELTPEPRTLRTLQVARCGHRPAAAAATLRTQAITISAKRLLLVLCCLCGFLLGLLLRGALTGVLGLLGLLRGLVCMEAGR